jgi:DNA polymerase I-like protein with 3'-5' exonuclease and polymerase domains
LAIAAALSGDPAMRDAYSSGDFYLTIAKMASAVPPDATKCSHGAIRDQFKTVALGVLFGLTAEGLARKIGVTPCYGRALLDRHKQTFRRFWEWSRCVVDRALITGRIETCFGWTLHVGPGVNPRALANFPMQAHGADMMRLAACLATERGITVCAPVHDAFLIEADADAIDAETARMRAAMREASELVLPGFPLRSDAKIVRHPDRYSDPRGERFWGVVQSLLAQLDGSDTPALEGRGTPSLQGTPVQSYFLSSCISL